MPKAPSTTTTTKAAKEKTEKTKKTMVPSPWSLYIASHLSDWRKNNLGKTHREAMQAISELWKDAPENPNRDKPSKPRKTKKSEVKKANKENLGDSTEPSSDPVPGSEV